MRATPSGGSVQPPWFSTHSFATDLTFASAQCDAPVTCLSLNNNLGFRQLLYQDVSLLVRQHKIEESTTSSCGKSLTPTSFQMLSILAIFMHIKPVPTLHTVQTVSFAVLLNSHFFHVFTFVTIRQVKKAADLAVERTM